VPEGKLVLVPYNLARLGDRLVGLDAFSWPFLEKRYRVVLLAHPVAYIEEVKGAADCRLDARVSVSEQIEEIRRIAAKKPEPPKMPRIRLGARLAWLFFPLSMLRHVFEEEAKGFEITEETQAVGLAKALSKLEPVGGTSYAVFSLSGDEFYPVQENMRRIYSELARRDPGYNEAVERARALCKA